MHTYNLAVYKCPFAMAMIKASGQQHGNGDSPHMAFAMVAKSWRTLENIQLSTISYARDESYMFLKRQLSASANVLTTLVAGN